MIEVDNNVTLFRPTETGPITNAKISAVKFGIVTSKDTVVGATSGYARYFIGNSYLNPLTDPEETIFLANVTFEPGCRNNWHIHHAAKGGGQILLCTDDRGWYQEWGKDARELHPGDVVYIPAEVKHWHGAAKDSWFSHIAFEAPGEDCFNEWREPVDDAQYGKLA